MSEKKDVQIEENKKKNEWAHEIKIEVGSDIMGNNKVELNEYNFINFLPKNLFK